MNQYEEGAATHIASMREYRTLFARLTAFVERAVPTNRVAEAQQLLRALREARIAEQRACRTLVQLNQQTSERLASLVERLREEKRMSRAHLN